MSINVQWISLLVKPIIPNLFINRSILNKKINRFPLILISNCSIFLSTLHPRAIIITLSKYVLEAIALCLIFVLIFVEMGHVDGLAHHLTRFKVSVWLEIVDVRVLVHLKVVDRGLASTKVVQRVSKL